MQCAVAYLLQMPLDKVPHFAESGEGEECWDMFDDYFLSLGEVICMYPPTKTIAKPYLASGDTARGTKHMVVMQNGQLLFDPHPSDEGLTKITCVWILAE